MKIIIRIRGPFLKVLEQARSIINKAKAGAKFASNLILNLLVRYSVAVKNTWTWECYGPDGVLKWREVVPNIVVNVGLDDLLTQYFKGSAYTAEHYVGLKSTGTPAAGDTMTSHATWTELVPYSNATRPTFTPGTVSGQSVDNSASKAVFNINDSSTVYGGFLVTDSTKSGTAGVLYGVADFTAQRAVESGDTLNVTATCTAATA
ncbi:MAG TPA: hypothetical protein VMY37_13820 [Thermoguttaceae bacterium]|nr:hypothetical protein [Thermoguttaceae bacterium]HUV65036.1 hypothetical protein [Sedimentisphaerales bacterium]